MEDVKFHQCVRLARFENDRTISFIPPDGEFELMSYRLSTPVKPLIWVEAAIESHKGRIEYMVKVKAQFKRRSSANNVEIYVPVPDDADSPKFRVSTRSTDPPSSTDALLLGIDRKRCLRPGQVSVRMEDQAAGWRSGVPHACSLWLAICEKRFVSVITDAAIPAFLLLIPVEEDIERRPPITVKFEIPYFTVSGIQVRYLKIVEKSGYQALPWVR